MSSAFSFGKLAAKILSLPDVKPYSGFDASSARAMVDEAKQRRDEKELKDFRAVKEDIYKQVYQAIHLAAQAERTYIRISSNYAFYYHKHESSDLVWDITTMRIFVKECQKHFEDQGYSFTYNLISTSEDCAHIYIEWTYPREG